MEQFPKSYSVICSYFAMFILQGINIKWKQSGHAKLSVCEGCLLVIPQKSIFYTVDPTLIHMAIL